MVGGNKILHELVLEEERLQPSPSSVKRVARNRKDKSKKSLRKKAIYRDFPLFEAPHAHSITYCHKKCSFARNVFLQDGIFQISGIYCESKSNAVTQSIFPLASQIK